MLLSRDTIQYCVYGVYYITLLLTFQLLAFDLGGTSDEARVTNTTVSQLINYTESQELLQQLAVETVQPNCPRFILV